MAGAMIISPLQDVNTIRRSLPYTPNPKPQYCWESRPARLNNFPKALHDEGRIEKKMEIIIVFWGYIGIMEKKMETIAVYWGYIGIM